MACIILHMLCHALDMEDKTIQMKKVKQPKETTVRYNQGENQSGTNCF